MEDERKDDRVEDAVDDLEVPEAEKEDLKGGALNAYIANVQGEKQNKVQGSVTQK